MAAPSTSPAILKFDISRTGSGSGRVVGPYTIATNDPISSPIIRYTIWHLNLLNALLIRFIEKMIPKSIPAARHIIEGSEEKSSVSTSCIPSTACR